MVAQYATLAVMKRRLITWIIVAVAVIAGLYWLNSDNTKSNSTNNTSQTNTHQSQQTSNSSGFDKTKYSLTDPNSLWVIVNKSHPLNPKTYIPADLVFPNVTQRLPGRTEMQMRRAAADALEQMFAAGETAGVKLLISTAYRGYSYQKALYDGYVRSDGQAAADKTSARPGYSEHQTGLAVDIRAQNGQCPVEQCFGTMTEGKWLAANAYKYGFVLRYPKNKESITGYEYEPWHFRYVGTDASYQMHKQGIETLEEFFSVSGGIIYKP